MDALARLPRQPPADMIILAEARRPGDPAARPAPSASVILVRDAPTGLETYLLHRHARMPFAASAVGFPGGRVDAVDVAGGGDPARACAVRETTEETGVKLKSDDLVPWAHWITPEPAPRRYDTRFFLAALPDGQHLGCVGETDSAGWEQPAEVLATSDPGDITLMPLILSDPPRSQWRTRGSVREAALRGDGSDDRMCAARDHQNGIGMDTALSQPLGEGTLADDH